MERVEGIGGLFFRSRDPMALAKWYEDHLGIDTAPGDYDTPPWKQAEGPTVFAPFAGDTEYFGRPEQDWMINFRVGNLDAMLAQLKAAGIKTEIEGDFPNGRFARLTDPEGNPIQLWEPNDRS